MKTFVLTGIIVFLTFAKGFALSEDPSGNLVTLKKTIAFYQQMVNLRWEQFENSVKQLKQNPKSAEKIEEERDFFIGTCQENIKTGVLVTKNEKAIAGIRRDYDKKLKRRRALENKEVLWLQALLKKELLSEQEKFEKVWKDYNGPLDDEASASAEKLDRHLTQSIVALESSDGNAIRLAASEE